jgi:hypothetical protein
MEYLRRPSEASTRYCVIPGGYPPQDWQSLPCAGEELDLNPGLMICSQVRYLCSQVRICSQVSRQLKKFYMPVKKKKIIKVGRLIS